MNSESDIFVSKTSTNSDISSLDEISVSSSSSSSTAPPKIQSNSENEEFHLRSKKMVKYFGGKGSFVFLVLLTIIILLLAVITFLTMIVLLKLEVIIFSPNGQNEIRLPEGKVLYDLNTFMYRNRTLYRYNSQYLVLNEHEEFERVYFHSDDELDEGDYGVMYASELQNERSEHLVECEGMCDCYADRNRRLGSLVFSKRYTATFAIVVLSWAAAKFVNDHVDDCYRAARKMLGEDVPISCSMDGGDDDFVKETEDMEYFVCKEIIKDTGRRKIYVCDGWCHTIDRKGRKIEDIDKNIIDGLKCERVGLQRMVLADDEKHARLEFTLQLNNHCLEKMVIISRERNLDLMNVNGPNFGIGCEAHAAKCIAVAAPKGDPSSNPTLN